MIILLPNSIATEISQIGDKRGDKMKCFVVFLFDQETVDLQVGLGSSS